MNRMKALVKEGPLVALRRIPYPSIEADDDVIVAVEAAGLCRTDLYAADGLIPTKAEVTLGHELAGVVLEVGPAVNRLRHLDRVTADPYVRCGSCGVCRSSAHGACPAPRMLGIDRDGAFAERVVVPASALHRLPEDMPFRIGAYVEPTAAALAVMNAGIGAGDRGLIYGAGRIAHLTRHILRASGVDQAFIHDPAGPLPLAESAYDFVVETIATAEALRAAVRAVRPGGKVVLKSRAPAPVALDVSAAIRKEITLHAVRYGSFPRAIELLAARTFDVDVLLGPASPLDDFARVFAEGRRAETQKLFFAPRASA